MQFTEKKPTRLDTGILVSELLGFSPSDFSPFGTKSDGRGHDVYLGLGALMRRALEVAIECSSRPLVDVRIDPQGTRAQRLAMLLAWALMQGRRRRSGLPFAPLNAEREDGHGEVAERLRRMSIDELIAELEQPVPVDPETRRDEFGQPESYAVSIDAMIRSLLGLDPTVLVHYRNDVAGAALTDDLEVQARIGLELLVHDVLAQYKVMRVRGASLIRLFSDDDAAEVKVPLRAAHVAALLAGSLLADECHDVSFLEPRTRSAEEKATLRETAKFVYGDFSEEALRGFDLLCDGIVHFGHGTETTLAEKLLYEVAPDCDPELQRMPYCVSWQVAMHALSEIG